MAKTMDREPFEIVIEDLAFGGEGVGRLDGQVQFVIGAFPGERVRAISLGGRKRWQRGRLIEVLEPSPDRIAPRCGHTGVCGGCVYQCLRYPAQVEAKARQVRENLARIGGVRPPEPDPPLPAPEIFGYRNKMEFSFATRPWDPEGVPEQPLPGPALGLHVRGRFDGVFDVRDCALVDPEVNELLALVRGFARERGIPAYRGPEPTGILRHLVLRMSRHSGEWLVALVVREDHPDLGELARRCVAAHPRIAGFLIWHNAGLATIARPEREVLLIGTDRIIEKLGGLEFELSAGSFFQTNSSAAEALLRELRSIAPSTETMLDLYCGVGTLGLGLADRCRNLVGIESVESAVADARRNAVRNGIEHARFEVATAEGWLTRAVEIQPDAVVIDPPRSGMHPKALAGLIRLNPRTILCVSCNPGTLARDLGTLTAAGYAATRMRILDLFPHTPHVETILRLERP
jgi:23S rRNA (uracil1939-C5)-methyltransferase